MIENKRKAALIALGFAVSAIFLAIFLSRISWADVATQVRGIDIWPWLAVAVLLDVTGFFVRGRRLQLLVLGKGTMSLPVSTNVVVVGHATNNVLPGRLGELIRSGMLTERTGIPFTQSLTITILERVLDGLTMLFLLLVAIALLPVGDWARDPILFVAPPFVLATIGILVMIVFPNTVTRVSSRLLGILPARWHDRLMRVVVAVVHGVAPLRSWKVAYRTALLSVMLWLVEGCVFYSVFQVLGIDLDFRAALLVMTIAHLGSLLPSSPAYIGVFHLACQQSLVLLGIGVNLATSYAIVVHLVFTVPCTIWGLGIIIAYSVELGQTLRLAARARSLDTLSSELPAATEILGSDEYTSERSEPSRLLSSVVDTILPRSKIPAEQFEPIHADTSRFIVSQLSQLPRRHQILFKLGMLSFRSWILLTRFRDFPSLSRPRREEILNRWMYGAVPLFRQLFRPVRSLAVLKFYEHPGVVQLLGEGIQESER